MATVDDLYARIAEAVALRSDDAAIRIRARYEPQGGPEAKVYPPTYLERDGTRYHFERRWTARGELEQVVVLDSYQSQANRCEAALSSVAAELGLPRIVLRVRVGGRVIDIDNLLAPHRSRDAYFIDGTRHGVRFDETEVGRELNEATDADLTALLKYSPADLIYGVWDSHRDKRIALKVARSYTSEIIGWSPEQGRRAATKGDPLNLPGGDTVPAREWRVGGTATKSKKDSRKLSDLGHGMVPGEADPLTGGVSVREITRLAVISLTGLARLRFGGNGYEVPARALLASIALYADRLAFGGSGIHLRSGCDLVLREETIEWVQRGGGTERLVVTTDETRALAEQAKRRLEESGVRWDPEPIVLEPIEPLAKVIEAVLRGDVPPEE